MSTETPKRRRYVLVVDLNEADIEAADFTLDDVEDALAARLGPEACFDEGGNPIHGRLVSVAWASTPDTFPAFLDALEVGSEGVEDAMVRDDLDVMRERLGYADAGWL